MDERYLRNMPALSEDEMKKLREKRVLVVGCGGLGGYICEMLLRAGVGFVRAVDGDVFEKTNLNRQLLSSVSALGKNKAAAAAERAAQIAPESGFEAVCEFLSEENAASLLRGCDCAIDALDNVPARRILSKACSEILTLCRAGKRSSVS